MLDESPALACPGLLLHLPGPDPARRLWPIWRREMGPGGQTPVWRDATMQAGRVAGGPPVRALCFVLDRAAPDHAGDVPVGRVADTLARAAGPEGSAADLLLDTAAILRANGMRDALLESLEAEVARRLAGRPDVPAG